ncbi:MAG: ComEC/Rec2 family competence protein [Armatimonadota bacterium]
MTRASVQERLAEFRLELESRLGLVAFLSLASVLSSGFVGWHLVAPALMAAFVRRRSAWIVIGVCTLIGFALRPLPPKLDFERKAFHGQLEVISIPTESELGQSAMAVMSGKRYRLFLPPTMRVDLGDVIEMGGEQEAPAETRNASRGEVAVLHPIGGVRVIRKGPSVFGWGINVRRSFVAFVEAALPPRSAATVEALCMGADYGIDDDQWDAFKRTGTVHVLVASGLQTMIAAAALLALLSRFRGRRELRLIFVLAFLFLYCAAAGFRPPVLRAAVMATLGYLHYLFGRQNDGLNSLGIACAVAIGLDPWAVFDVGLWLSVTAVGGLAMQSEFDGSLRGGFADWWKQLFQTNLVATVSTAPLTACLLGQFSVAGLLANMIVVPVMEVVLGASLLSWALGIFLPGVGVLLLQVAVGPVVERLLAGIEQLAHLPFSTVQFGWFSPYWLVPIYGGMVLLWRPRRLRAD